MATDKTLAYYIFCFKNLHRAANFGGAPHKPVLLLAIIHNVEQGLIANEKIFITPDLVGAFKSQWRTFVTTPHTMKFSLPFYYMKSEPFWQLIPKTFVDLAHQTRNALELFSNLNHAIDHALIDEELFFFLSQKESRELLKLILIQRYFPQYNISDSGGPDYVSDITHDILEEDPAHYRERLALMEKKLKADEYTEEVFLRGGIFKRVVPQIYNNTCCITGLNISATFAVSMVDACHIIPFSESHDDTITNGIALSPNMHRAFDRGLITIGTDYKVKVSDSFKEESPSPYSIKQFDGKQILLPKDKRYYPNRENLEWHGRERFL